MRKRSFLILGLAMLASNQAISYENDEYDWLYLNIKEEKSKPSLDPLEFSRIKQTKGDFEPIFAEGADAKLLIAAKSNDLTLVKDQVKSGANINAADKFGWRPLVYAAQSGNVEMVRFLLDQHADTNVKGGGYRPLGVAAMNGHIQIVKMLLRAGALVNLKGASGNTALIDAVYSNQPEIISILLKAGADPSLANFKHWNAMSVAAIEGNVEAMQALLSGGGDPNLLDGDGFSPLYWATNHQNENTMSLLAGHGARIKFNVP